MANKALFKSLVGRLVPPTDTLNAEFAPAYRFTPRQALAQYAATGCLNGTFYASGQEQLATVLGLCNEVDAEFIAKTAVYARRRGHMKDMPALLCAVLSVKDPAWLGRAFPLVMDNGRLLRNFVQIVRSGATGRKSLGTLPKRLVQNWLADRPAEALFRDSVGQSPSLKDVVRMVHPRPADPDRAAFYAYLLGREADPVRLPPVIRHFEAFKRGERGDIPDVPFQLLTALNLGQAEWTAVARQASWQTTRMNLNTFARHGVFADAAATELVAARLRDPQLIEKARVFPYQLLAAHAACEEGVPSAVRAALADAVELATQNVPAIEGKVYVFPDVSGSMMSPVTGLREGAASKVRCIDVAALVAAAVLRKNPQAEVIPFQTEVVSVVLNPRDAILTNAAILARSGGGGTNCSAPLRALNRRKARGDLVIFVSDNESWVDAGVGRGTATLQEWNVFRARNPQARLVCLDIQPGRTTQAGERADILNLGGFSDEVFETIRMFAAGCLTADHWVGCIEAVEL